MIHVKKTKINQEKVKLWALRKLFHFICAALYLSAKGLSCFKPALEVGGATISSHFAQLYAKALCKSKSGASGGVQNEHS